MANFNVSDFDKFKAFFKALQDINFDPAKPIPGIVKINGRPTPVDKTRCFELLRSMPALQGKDDSEIIKYLRQPGNINRLLGKELTRAQQIELAQTLAEKPIPPEEISEQLTGQEAATEQTPPAQAPAGPSGGGAPFGMPSTPAIGSVSPRMPQRILVKPPEGIPTSSSSTPITPTTSVTSGIPASRSASTPATPSLTASSSSSNLPTQTFKTTVEPKSFQSIPSATVKRFNLAPLKGFSSRLGVFFQRNLGKYLTVGRIATGVSAGIGAITGGALTNGSAVGIFGGGGLGAIAPSWIKSGGGTRFLGKVGNGAINAGVRISNQVSTGATRFSASKRWAVGGVIGLFLILALATGLMSGPSVNPPTTGATPIVGASNISSCKFTRAGVAIPFTSSLLLSYIQEAAQKSSVPAVVLAAFIRVESPSAAYMSNQEITNYAANCAQSTTGALGIMQIQPPGTTSLSGTPASCDDCIDAGAKLVGKTVATMTRADYCDPRTSIIVGSGWILKKMSKFGLGDGTKWDPSWINDKKAIETMVRTYYGCLNYGGAQDCTGPYNYATDVQTSIQDCKPAPGASPAPPGPIGFSVSCPLEGNIYISCGTAANPAANTCGHGVLPIYKTTCDPYYYVCNGSRYSEALYHAIDVQGNNTVTLPYINGNESIQWTRVDPQPIAIGQGSWGYRIDYTATYQGKRLYLDLTHLNSNISTAQTLMSGETVGTVFQPIGHLHTGLSVDDTWMEPIQDARMCSQ